MRSLTLRSAIPVLAALDVLAALVAWALTRSVPASLTVAALGAIALVGLQTQRQTRSVHRALAQARQVEHQDLTTLRASLLRQEESLRALQRVAGDAQRAAKVAPSPGPTLPFAGAPATAQSVTLVLDTLTSPQLFAGVKTAILAAAHAATQTGLPLRIAAMHDPAPSDNNVMESVRTIVRAAGHDGVAGDLLIGYPRSLIPSPRRDDIIIVTFWRTAHHVGELVSAGRIDPDRVIYLVQDFEPGFYAWGTEHALAERTYSRGFRLLVNSAPLARHVQEMTGVEIPADRVFAPFVDGEALRTSADMWRPFDRRRPRVLFYARPSKPRNLFPLGVDALRDWITHLPEDVSPRILVAGEKGARVSLPERAAVEHLGQVSLPRYHELLSEVDLGLALMFSPHPSHLPLELPMAGIPTVTNRFGHIRTPWIPGLRVAPTDPRDVALAIEEARLDAATLSRHQWQPLPAELGLPLTDAMAHTLAGL